MWFSFSRKHREGFLVKKRWRCTHHGTRTLHVHHTTVPTHRSLTPHHSTYIAHVHHTTAFTPFAYTTTQHRFFFFSLISKAGVGLAGVGGMHPSAGLVRVEALSLWRPANSKLRLRTGCGLCVSKRSRGGAVRILSWLR